MSTPSRVLVVGHQGYIGPIVIAALKRTGYHVSGLDTGYFRDNIYYDPEHDCDQVHRTDLRDIEAEHLRGFFAVVHLAGLSNDPLGELNPQLTDSINTKASERLADLTKAAGVERFIFASSCSIYGAASQHEIPLDEQAPCNPVSAYAVSKLAMEQYLKKQASDHFTPVNLRFATAFGLSPRVRLDLVVNNLMANAVLTGIVKVLSDGSPWRPLTHIQDIALSIIASLHAPRENIHGQSFNIGRNDANYQVRDIAKIVAEKVPGSKLEITGEAGGDPRSYRVDFSKAHAMLPEFRPQWTLERGATELYEAFQRQKLPADALKNPQFIRLKQLQLLIDQKQLQADLRWAKKA